MSNPFSIQTFPLVSVGGVPPYSYAIIRDAQDTFFLSGGVDSIITVAGVPNLKLDATNVVPGVYATHVRVTDSATPSVNTADSFISVVINDPTLLSILNDDQDFLPPFPQNVSLTLLVNGGTQPYTWSLISSVTTVTNPTITGPNPATLASPATLNFTLPSFGQFVAGLNVVDSVGNSAAIVVLYTAVNPAFFALVDGQLEVEINVPSGPKVGQSHSFQATVQDSSVPPNVVTSPQLSYRVLEPFSVVSVPEAFFDHYWAGSNDTTAVVFPIVGLSNLQGYALGSPTITQPSNGLTVTVDNVNDVVKVAGPPTQFQSAHLRIPFQILHGSTQVALISREYALLAHSSATDIGNAVMLPRPFIVGDLVGLNPQKPWFNSPSIQKNSKYTVRVQAGSALPPGLSLDANTGLIYGNVAGTISQLSVIEYVDVSGLVHGTITIPWTIFNSQFVLINTAANLGPALVGQSYTGTISSNSASALTSVTLAAGVLPQGLTVSIGGNGSNVTISGTPLEAGYFDIWLQVTNATNQTAYLYLRFTSNFILPLSALTTSLATFSNQFYSAFLQAFGGVPPYTWNLDPTSPSLPGGFSLSTSGVLSGTYTNAPTPYSQNLVIDVIDSETPPLSTQVVLNLTYNNALVVVSPAIPIIVPGQPYSFAMQASGGVPPYTWSISPSVNGLVPPTGISFNTSGIFSGVTSQTSFSEPVTIQVTDSASTTAQHAYTLQIGSPSGLIINTADVGTIFRGVSYQGHLSVSGPGTAPYAWQIPPSSPNQLPAGLVLTPDSGTSGVTATVSGIYSPPPGSPVFTNLPVEVEVIDANGQSAFAYMLMSTGSNVTIITTSLPPGEISGLYSFQFTASGGVPPYTFSLDPSSPALPVGFTLASNGLLSGTTAVAYNKNIIIDVADSLTPANTNLNASNLGQTFNLLIQATSLTITNLNLPNITAGQPYTAQLMATETPALTPFVWGISPLSQALLPQGLVLNSSTGVISGTTQVIGASAVTFRVTDAIGAFADKTLNLSTLTGLALRSGVEFSEGIGFWTPLNNYALNTLIVDSNGNVQQVTTAGTSGATTPAWHTSGTTNDGGVVWTFVGPSYLGYIINGNVAAMNTRPNDSFFVVATSVLSTAPSQLGVTVGSLAISGIVATVKSITNGVAQIQLTGPFAQAAPGDNSLTVTVTDFGVQVSAPFKWKVVSSGNLRLAPGTGTFPVRVIG